MEAERHGGKRTLPKQTTGRKAKFTKLPKGGRESLLGALTAWEKRTGNHRPTQWEIFKAARKRALERRDGV